MKLSVICWKCYSVCDCMLSVLNPTTYIYVSLCMSYAASILPHHMLALFSRIVTCRWHKQGTIYSDKKPTEQSYHTSTVHSNTSPQIWCFHLYWWLFLCLLAAHLQVCTFILQLSYEWTVEEIHLQSLDTGNNISIQATGTLAILETYLVRTYVRN